MIKSLFSMLLTISLFSPVILGVHSPIRRPQDQSTVDQNARLLPQEGQQQSRRHNEQLNERTSDMGSLAAQMGSNQDVHRTRTFSTEILPDLRHGSPSRGQQGSKDAVESDQRLKINRWPSSTAGHTKPRRLSRLRTKPSKRGWQ